VGTSCSSLQGAVGHKGWREKKKDACLAFLSLCAVVVRLLCIFVGLKIIFSLQELSFQKGDEFKLFASAQGWYKAYKLPLGNNEAGMVPGNYIKEIPEPKAAAPALVVESSPPPPSKQDRTSQKLTVPKASDVDDALARASRRRGMTEKEVEGEKVLKVKIQDLESELKNSEFRHRAELADLKSEQTRLKAQNKKLEDEATVLENKVLLLETAGSFQDGGSGNAEVEAELRKEIEKLKEARKADVEKASKQWERKMDRAQAEIDELQEQVNKSSEKEKSLTAQLKAAGSASSAAVAAPASKEAEKENEKLRDEVTKLKDMLGGYLDMIEDLKDELDEAKNGAGGGGDAKELEELQDQVDQLKADSDRLRKGEKQLLAEVAELESKEQEQTAQLEDLMKTNGALLKELEKTQKRAQDLETDLEGLRGEADEMKLKLAEAEEQQSGVAKGGATVVELEGRVRAVTTENNVRKSCVMLFF
jgi:DNA repair exonuclease SbcCD ATPase subunit